MWQERALARRIAVIGLMVGAAGCDPDRTARPETLGPSPQAPTYLRYGVPVPQGERISVIPEPYDEHKHGPAVRNTRPEANVAGRPDVQLPRVSRGRGPGQAGRGGGRPSILPGSGDRGFWIYNSIGVFAGNNARTDLSIPDNAIGTTIYAPTHMPAGNACVETVTAHWRYQGFGGTAHAHGFWDHCGVDGSQGWQTFEFMDASWMSRYVRIFDGQDHYFTEAYRDANGCWHGLLYNFSLGQWEEKLSAPICGSSGWSQGWTMWESHHLMDVAQVCPVFPAIRASSIQVYYGSGWAYLDGSNSGSLGPYGLCWTNGSYTLDVHAANWDWHAHTPNP